MNQIQKHNLSMRQVIVMVHGMRQQKPLAKEKEYKRILVVSVENQRHKRLLH